MNVAGTSFETALPWTEDKRTVLDRMLGPGSYQIRRTTAVERRGNWYEALSIDLYSGTPTVIYFRWPFPPGAHLAAEWMPRDLPPIRTALALGDSEAGINPGAFAIMLGAGLFAAGYVLTKGQQR